MAAVDDVIERALRAPYTMGVPRLPSSGVAIVTCMDTRMDVRRIFDLGDGEVHVIRNAGGYATPDVLRSLAISQRKIGTREILVCHHTDCGMSGHDDAEFRASIAAETGRHPDWDVEGYADEHDAVANSVALIKACPFIPHRDHVRGVLYDVKSGRLDVVS
ncbi:MAG: carbonic anhydrase [Frankiales bacterium]|nr:carbonic anhydrase [Frankiales bacterium]